MARTKEHATEATAEELERLERQAEADERALAGLRDDLHNASVASAQAQGTALHAALSRKRELERELDQLLEASAPVLTRLKDLRQQLAAERRTTQLVKLRAAGTRFTEASGPVTDAVTDTCAKLAALTQAATAVNEAARGCGPDVLRDVTAGLQLSQIVSWLLNQLDDAGLRGISPAVLMYDPHQRATGVAPTEASADLAIYLETTR